MRSEFERLQRFPRRIFSSMKLDSRRYFGTKEIDSKVDLDSIGPWIFLRYAIGAISRRKQSRLRGVLHTETEESHAFTRKPKDTHKGIYFWDVHEGIKSRLVTRCDAQYGRIRKGKMYTTLTSPGAVRQHKGDTEVQSMPCTHINLLRGPHAAVRRP